MLMEEENYSLLHRETATSFLDASPRGLLFACGAYVVEELVADRRQLPRKTSDKKVDIASFAELSTRRKSIT